MSKMLEVSDINVFYGAIHAIKDVSFSVDEGEIVTLIGANGAGKTTLLSTISGVLKSTTGSITFENTKVSEIPAYKIVYLGLAHVPEGRQIFSGLTVEENLEMGAYILKDMEMVKNNIKRSYELFPRLLERRKQKAGTLSGGEQQMLAIARALMSNPKMLLLDEPSMGLSPLLVSEVFSIIKEVNKSGVTIVLVEQNAKAALKIADKGYVVETGKIVLAGEAKDLLVDERVKKAYLGA